MNGKPVNAGLNIQARIQLRENIVSEQIGGKNAARTFMRKRLNISMVINCILLGVVILLLIERRNKLFATAAATRTNPSQLTVEPVTAAPDVVPIVKPAFFHWSQLEAVDYKIFIANLRSIGCPEPTIRDIIAADVDASIYAPRRENLKQSRSASSPAPLDSLSRYTMESEMQLLNIEEAAMIATLLGWPVASEQAAALAPTGAPDQTEGEAAPVAMPLVWREVDLSALGLEGQTYVIANLRQRFLEEIGGTNQDPNDPAYRERWQQAEAEANRTLEGMIGLRAYQAYDLKVRAAGAAGNF